MHWKLHRALFCCLLWAAFASGAERVVFRSGFELRADHVEPADGYWRLTLGLGVVQVPAAEIARIESEQDSEPARAISSDSPATPDAPLPPLGTVDVRELVTRAAVSHGLPPEFVHSVAIVESGYRTDARSPRGALGPMQLLPSTARALAANPHDPQQNVDAGVRYLRQLLLKYKDDPNPVRRALAAYNAGPGAVDKYDGVPPYAETQQYIEKVLRQYWKLVKQAPPESQK